MDSKKLAEACGPFFQNAGLRTTDYKLGDIVQLEQGRAHTLVELVEEVSFIFVDTLNYESELLVWKKSTLEDAREKLELLSTFLESIGGWSTETLEEKTMPWIKENGFGNGDVLWPMRVALSGKKNSPGPFEIASVLGKEKTLLRLERARKKLAL